VSDLVGQWLPVQAQATTSDHPRKAQELATRVLKLVLLQTLPQLGRQHAAVAAVSEAAWRTLQLHYPGKPGLPGNKPPPTLQSSSTEETTSCVEELRGSLEGLTSLSGIQPGLARQAKAMFAEAVLLISKMEASGSGEAPAVGFSWVESPLLAAMKEGHWVSCPLHHLGCALCPCVHVHVLTA
jgi:hypothetical protein